MCYESRKLNKHEKNYVMHDIELEKIIHALNMWIHSLLGSWFLLMSDHSGPRYLFYKLNLNDMQARWFATIREFEF